ncbi:hypothetical protein D770_14200 [Flammeovirgaceae bacterium 311]|nr:hypothetical protein D770_14200 [Flammeovirgaceae bacterium 311]
MAKTVLKWGFLTALFTFLWLSLEYLVGIQTDYIAFHPVITLLALLIPLLCMYYGLREEKLKAPREFSFSKGLITGLYISGVAAILGVLGHWIFYTWVNPDFFSNMITYTESRALAQGIDVLVARREAEAYYTMESYLLQSVGGALLGGAVISAILSFFMRYR